MSVFEEIRASIFGYEGQPQLLDQAQRRAMPQLNEAGTQRPQPINVEQVLVEIDREKSSPALNWRTSVADLMELLGLDCSSERRRQLAVELGYEGEFDEGREMNLWLYRRVMQELEERGGRVPTSLKH